tara:strand:- start:1876 stop:2505 length:630 start_codon:yes stop_codon:yes gene_type:complete
MEVTVEYVRVPRDYSYDDRDDFLQDLGYNYDDLMPTLVQICSKPQSKYESGLNRDYVIKHFKKDDILIFMRKNGKIIGCCFVDIIDYITIFKDIRDKEGYIRYSRPIDERFAAVINIFCITEKKGKVFMAEIEKIILQMAPFAKVSIFLTPKTKDLQSYYRKYGYKNNNNMSPEGRLGEEISEEFVKHIGYKSLRKAPRSSPYIRNVPR